MQIYAYVDGMRALPFKNGRGVCGCCSSPVIAKCGNVRAHHWAHEARDDCDTWSEGMGPWHVSWQSLVQPHYVEYVIKPHRADILGSGDTVIELQHSPISTEAIREREAFYGNMVWLFDATYRFAAKRFGDRCFFTLSNTQHIHACGKPVLLDFGDYIVEVERLPSKRVVSKFAGYGQVRDRRWFCEEHLGDRVVANANVLMTVQGPTTADAWAYPLPWLTMGFPSKWIVNNHEVLYTAEEPYIQLPYVWTASGQHQWEKIIQECPEIANGWTKDECKEMQLLLSGLPIIVGGYLRVVPRVPFQPPRGLGAKLAKELVEKMRVHAHHGRIPLMGAENLQAILDANTPSTQAGEGSPSLFDAIGLEGQMRRW